METLAYLAQIVAVAAYRTGFHNPEEVKEGSMMFQTLVPYYLYLTYI